MASPAALPGASTGDGRDAAATLRIDKLLWFLRLTKSRERAQALIAEGHVRLDSKRVERASVAVHIGSVIVLPIGNDVRVVRIDRLPTRRGPAPEAQACYVILTDAMPVKAQT